MRRHQHDPGAGDGRADRSTGNRSPGQRAGLGGARSAPAEAPDLFGTAYSPAAATPGGTIIIGDWQEATQFNPYYCTQVTEANVASSVWHSLLTITDDFKYIPQLAAEPIPTTDNGGVTVGQNGDAMTVTWKLRDGLKWSDGEPLTCDDFKYAWEWVLDPDNAGVISAGWENIKDFECASDTDMIWHFDAIYEGYLTLAVAPLPRHYLKDIPIADQVKGAGFGVEDIAKLPVSGPFKFESVTPAAELRLVKNPNYTNPRTGAPANLDSIIFKWYGDPDAMIAGFRAGEIDVAFDLAGQRHPEGPGPRRAGRGHPGPPVRVPAPELVAQGRLRRVHQERRLLAQRGGPGPWRWLPDVRPGDPPGHRLRDRQERDQHAPPRRQRPGREHQHQPGGVVLR